jgi:hypothetical protein
VLPDPRLTPAPQRVLALLSAGSTAANAAQLAGVHRNTAGKSRSEFRAQSSLNSIDTMPDNAHRALMNFRLTGIPAALFVSRAGEHRKARILWKARIADGKRAEMEKGTTVRADRLDVGTSGTQTYRFVDFRPPVRLEA